MLGCEFHHENGGRCVYGIFVSARLRESSSVQGLGPGGYLEDDSSMVGHCVRRIECSGPRIYIM